MCMFQVKKNDPTKVKKVKIVFEIRMWNIMSVEKDKFNARLEFYGLDYKFGHLLLKLFNSLQTFSLPTDLSIFPIKIESLKFH